MLRNITKNNHFFSVILAKNGNRHPINARFPPPLIQCCLGSRELNCWLLTKTTLIEGGRWLTFSFLGEMVLWPKIESRVNNFVREVVAFISLRQFRIYQCHYPDSIWDKISFILNLFILIIIICTLGYVHVKFNFAISFSFCENIFCSCVWNTVLPILCVPYNWIQAGWIISWISLCCNKVRQCLVIQR